MEYTLKKSLGQHFLHDADMCRRIVDALEAPSGRVLEIGPGGGAITRFLLERGFAITAAWNWTKRKYTIC